MKKIRFDCSIQCNMSSLKYVDFRIHSNYLWTQIDANIKILIVKRIHKWIRFLETWLLNESFEGALLILTNNSFQSLIISIHLKWTSKFTSRYFSSLISCVMENVSPALARFIIIRNFMNSFVLLTTVNCWTNYRISVIKKIGSAIPIGIMTFIYIQHIHRSIINIIIAF